MSKEYKFKGKTYIVAKVQKGLDGCRDCVFKHEPNNVCRKFLQSIKAPNCASSSFVFKEKPAERTAKPSEPVKGKEVKLVDGSGRVIAPITFDSLPYQKQVLPEAEEMMKLLRTPIREPKNKTFVDLVLERYEIEAELRLLQKKTAHQYIVCLLESGNLAPSTNPKHHKTRESADKEALRLCKLYHQEFAVLQVVSAIKPQEPKKEVFA